MPTILCIDDDHKRTDLMRFGLTRDGFNVVTASTGHEGVSRISMEPIDLVILDADMPDADGFKAIFRLCTRAAIPIILIGSGARDEDIIAGLEQGAADYVVTPFNLEILIMRVKAVLRRAVVRTTRGTARPDGPVYWVAGAILDREVRELAAPDGQRIRLTSTESRILELLIVHAGQALSSEQIMECLWGADTTSNANVIKTHIRYLRQKIALLPGSPSLLRTVPGAGYALSVQGGAERTADTETVRDLRALG